MNTLAACGRPFIIRTMRRPLIQMTLLAAVLAALASGVRAQGPAIRTIAPLRDFPNLVYNGSFEYGDWWNADKPEYWAERAVLHRDSRVCRDGLWSLRVDGYW